jgi:hypothetical protein
MFILIHERVAKLFASSIFDGLVVAMRLKTTSAKEMLVWLMVEKQV